MIPMEELKKNIEPGEKGSVIIAGTYDNLKTFSDHLEKISEKLSCSNEVEEECFATKRLEYLKKPLLTQLVTEIDTGEYDELLMEEDLELVKEIIGKDEITKGDYDVLVDKISGVFSENLYSSVKEHFEEIDKSIKEDYGLEIIRDDIFASVDILYNDMYFSDGFLKFERYGMPVKVDENSSMEEFYLLKNGGKAVYDQNNSIVFTNKTDEGLIDLLENGLGVKDILDKGSEKGHKKKYEMETDYSIR